MMLLSLPTESVLNNQIFDMDRHPERPESEQARTLVDGNNNEFVGHVQDHTLSNNVRKRFATSVKSLLERELSPKWDPQDGSARKTVWNDEFGMSSVAEEGEFSITRRERNGNENEYPWAKYYSS